MPVGRAPLTAAFWSGLVVSQPDEKSQIKNRATVMKVLRPRLYGMETRRRHDGIAQDRRSRVPTGGRRLAGVLQGGDDGTIAVDAILHRREAYSRS